MIHNEHIPIKNIYWMLAYAFDALEVDEVRRMASEDFDGSAADLLAELLSRGMESQLRRGVARGYAPRNEELAVVRGRLDFPGTLRASSLVRERVVCEYDEFSEDIFLNQVVKTAAQLLLASSEVSPDRRRRLRRTLAPLGNVSTLDPRRIRWNEASYDRNNATYRLLVSLSRLVIEGALQSEEPGAMRFEGLSERQECALYERFLRNYFKREHGNTVTSHAPEVPWATDDGATDMLPTMCTDVTLRTYDAGDASCRTLIIDAKYYRHTTQSRSAWGTHTVHSNNLYQIFCYVKNEQERLTAAGNPNRVSGMLLYARTDEEVQPCQSYRLSGNRIDVRTLDLDCDWQEVRRQLDGIVEEFF